MKETEPIADVDPDLRRAIDLLNRLPGAATRASCQGKGPAGGGTHADLAYVLFREPMPLTLEDHLLENLGEIARVEPDGVHCRWPERNAELCRRLELAAAARRRGLGKERWRRAAIGLDEAERGLAERILGERAGDVSWCLDCGHLGESEGHASHRIRLLFRADGARTLAVLRDYLATDPPDPRLIEREGEQAILERLRRGDFGDAYREAWRSHARHAAALFLRGEMRSIVRALRSPESSTDFHLTETSVVLSVRSLA